MSPGEIDFQGGGPSGPATCDGCGRQLRDQYWAAAGKIACETCRELIDASGTSGTPASRFLVASALGVGAMTLGTVAWWALGKFAGINAAILAIGIGWLVGTGIRFGTQGRGGLVYQIMSVTLTYLSITFATMFLIIGHVRAEAPDTGVLAYPAAFVLAFISPVMGGLSSILSVIIIGIGLVAAWKMNRPFRVEWSGPHAVSQGASGEAPPPLPPPPPTPGG